MKNLAYWMQYLPLAFNFTLAVLYLVSWTPGKLLYWLGATILTIGLIRMEG